MAANLPNAIYRELVCIRPTKRRPQRGVQAAVIISVVRGRGRLTHRLSAGRIQRLKDRDATR
jgi:hypothetical protein